MFLQQTHERDLNSKLGMDLKRKMLMALADMSEQETKLDDKQQKVFNRYKHFMIPVSYICCVVGLNISKVLI